MSMRYISKKHTHAVLILLLISGVLLWGFSVARAAIVSSIIATASDTSIIVTWTTDVPTDSCVQIGQNLSSLSLYASSGCGSGAGFGTLHTFTIPNLGSETTYYYTVGYQNPSPSYASDIKTIVTAAPGSNTSAGVSFSVQPVSVTGTTAEIRWTTNVETDSCVKLGKTSTTLINQGCALEGGLRSLNHSHVFTGLDVATYYFTVGHSNPLPTTYDATLRSFTVTNAYTTVPFPPVLAGPWPSASSPVNLSWNAVSQASEYRLFRRTPPNSGSWTSSSITPVAYSGTAYADSAVTPGVSYQYYIAACNPLGCSGAYNYLTVNILASSPIPTLAPTTIIQAPTEESSSIRDGDLVRAVGDVDVYIVKFVGQKKFRRLVLSPSVFTSYRHLKWENVIEISVPTLAQFMVSDLVRAVNDPKTYRLYPAGDTGQKRWVVTADAFVRLGFDWDAIYEINSFDRDSYVSGAVIE